MLRFGRREPGDAVGEVELADLLRAINHIIYVYVYIYIYRERERQKPIYIYIEICTYTHVYTHNTDENLHMLKTNRYPRVIDHRFSTFYKRTVDELAHIYIYI